MEIVVKYNVSEDGVTYSVAFPDFLGIRQDKKSDIDQANRYRDMVNSRCKEFMYMILEIEGETKNTEAK